MAGKRFYENRSSATLALIILGLLLGACHHSPPKAPNPPAPPPPPGPNLFDSGEHHFGAGEYSDAIESYEAYLSGKPESSNEDAALFHLALSYGLSARGDEGFRNAQKRLRTLVMHSPRSPYKSQSEYLLSLQADIERLKVDLKEKDDLLRERSEPMQEKVIPAEEADKSPPSSETNRLRQQRDKLARDALEKDDQIKSLQNELEKVKDELERMKKIDLQRRPSRPPG